MKHSNTIQKHLSNHKNSIKALFTILLSFIMTFATHSQDALKLSDFEILNNTSWKGQLTYKDYQSGKQNTIDATLQISIIDQKLINTVQYTYEPNKNNTSSVKLKKNGTYFGNEKVVSNSFENGTRTFVTTYNGKDNGKKATMYMTRQFNENSFIITKEVQLENSDERFVRNTYRYTKLKH